MSPLPLSLTFSRLGSGDSNIFQCEPHWPNPNDGYCDEAATSKSYGHLYFQLAQIHAGRPPRNQHASDAVTSPIRDRLMPCLTGLGNKPCSGPLNPALSLDDHAQDSVSENPAKSSYSGHFPSASSWSSSAAQRLLHNNAARLLPPIDFAPQEYHGYESTDKAPTCLSREVSSSSRKSDGLKERYLQSKQSEIAVGLNPANSDPPDPTIHHQQSLGRNDAPQKPRSLHKISASGELRRDAGWPLADTQPLIEPVEEYDSESVTDSLELNAARHCEQPSTPVSSRSRLWIEPSSSEESVEQAHSTTVISPTKPRLITISPRTPLSTRVSSQPATPRASCPALVSAFSPDTPPETPDVANRNEVFSTPTSPHVNDSSGLGSLDSKIGCPITPPNSRVPTPFDRLTSSACFRKHSRWVHPSMAQPDESTSWVLQELEALLGDFPTARLRLKSPVIEHIRAVISGRHAQEALSRDRSSTAPHSRYSPYHPLSSHPTSPPTPFPAGRRPLSSRLESPHRASRSPQTDPPPSADSTAFALRGVFPGARPHHLDSLQASYLALHYITNLPSSDFTAAAASPGASAPFTSKTSRSSSLASDVPPKARAMLGIDVSPAQTSNVRSPSPTRSWFRPHSPELDDGFKERVENLKVLLEAVVRKLLAEIEGRGLGKGDEALVRAVGEVVRMGERKRTSRG
ncbi:MAG: hypothetical protein Q9174_003186 [Haloplaca sp. 1 TL-2023]